MSLVPSLLQAIVKADGEAMVMHAGDKPYVVSPTGQVELASRGLTLEAVTGIVGQLLPAEIQSALEEFGAIQYELPAPPEFPGEHFTVVAARGGDDVWVEIRRRRVPDEDRVPEEMFPPAPAAAAVAAAPAAPPPPPAVAAPVPAVAAPVAAVALTAAPQQEAIAAHAATPAMSVASETAHQAAPPVPAVAAAAAKIDIEDEGEEINLDDDLGLPDETQLFGTPVKPFTDAELAEGREEEIDVDATDVQAEDAASVREPEPVVEAEIPPLAASIAPSAVPAPAVEPVAETVVAEKLAASAPLEYVAPPHAELIEPPRAAPVAPPQAEMVAATDSEWVALEPELAVSTQPDEIAEVALPVELVAAAAEPAAAPSSEPVAPQDIELIAALETKLTSPLRDAIPQSASPVELIAAPPAAPVASPESELITAFEPEPVAPPEPRMFEAAMPAVEAVAPLPVKVAAAPASEQTPMPQAEFVAPPIAESRVVPRRPAERWTAPPNVEPTPHHSPVAEAPRVEEAVTAAPEPRAIAPASESPRPAAAVDEPHEIAVATAPQAAVVLPISRSPIRGEQLAPALSEATMPGLEPLLRLASARGASTLYLSSESRPSMRIDGELHVIDAEPVHTSRDVESLLLTLMPERNHEALRSGAQTEWICDIDGVGRVRCMSFRDHRGPGGVFRLMPTRSVSVEQLGLPRHVQSLAIEPSGLVLIAGPRSSGKRTLMAAFVDLMNRTRRDHIITIEREINIVQEGGHSFISQREVRGDDEEMVVAARSALREDPDVLVIEDLRTGPLVNVALEAAAAGRLVVGGFSAHTAGGAIDRIIDLYAPEERRRVQMALADSLRGVVVQVLLRKIGGGRLPAREVLLNTPSVSSVIAEGKTSQLPMAIEGGRRHGMVPMNDALVALVQSGAVEAREAYRQSPDRPGFLASLTRNGLDTSFVERLA